MRRLYDLGMYSVGIRQSFESPTSRKVNVRIAEFSQHARNCDVGVNFFRSILLPHNVSSFN